jgi:RimJ/RimL family protein N-acetyltransferase
MNLREFKVEDFDAIHDRLRFHDRISVGFFGADDYRERLADACCDHPVVTFEQDGEVVAIAGAVRLWDGVATYWMLTSDLVDKYPVGFIRACKRGLESLHKCFGIHRLEASIAAGHDVSEKWAQYMGFECEGVMRAYSPSKSDHYRYARCWL